MDPIVAKTLLNGFMAGLQKKADPLLRDMHKEAMNVGSQQLLGAVDVLESLEILSPEGATHWKTVAQLCPENRPESPGHGGGRKFCAYCGELDEDDE
jgi:hypothetical protein